MTMTERTTSPPWLRVLWMLPSITALAMSVFVVAAYSPGMDSYPFLAMPPIFGALPLYVRPGWPRRLVAPLASALLLGFCVIGGFSVGLFYVPSLLLLLVAWLVDEVVWGAAWVRRQQESKFGHPAE
jgi:hypothetical protein